MAIAVQSSSLVGEEFVMGFRKQNVWKTWIALAFFFGKIGSLDDAEVVVLAYGATARSARHAVKKARQENIKAGLYQPLSLWPFPAASVDRLAEQAHTIVVPEMNLGQYRIEVERTVRGRAEVVGVNRANGELLSPDEIMQAILEVVNK